MGQRKIQVLAAQDLPWPEGQIYVTVGDLAKRYGVVARTIRRWNTNQFLPLNIDSQMEMLRWDIEELKEFEDDLAIAFTGSD